MTWKSTLALAVLVFATVPARAGDVSGRVRMPDVCSPGVSPAVVVLEPLDHKGSITIATAPAKVALVNQRGLQFVPRVQAIVLGQTLRFTNDDSELHNVHIISPGNQFNESMAPGQPRDFTPVRPGVVRLACDIHAHMRGYIVVSRSPWVKVCSADGLFDVKDVPAGQYNLTVWHEMGDALKKTVTVEPTGNLDLGELAVTADITVPIIAGQAAPVRSWPDVIDRISVLLGSSLEAAGRADGFKKARKLANDAYFIEFEGSEMETAVRLHLGSARASAIERKFRAIVPTLREVSTKNKGTAAASDATRELLLALVEAGRDLNTKGVTDSAHLRVASAQPSEEASETMVMVDRATRLAALRAGFDRVQDFADQGDAEEAAAQMATLYFDAFDPLEKVIQSRRPGDKRPLEEQYSAIRGELGAGTLRGEPLAKRLEGLQSLVVASLDKIRDQPAGTFAPAFGASFVTAVREGAEVILLLAMLIALAAKTGQVGAFRAIAWGVGLAVLASAITAVGLNSLVSSAQGRMRELLEGGVMLAASAVLFYVSYWLISQSESKRWTSFLKRQAASGRRGTTALLVTAFLAVYREGAETALMYQAMIGSQGGSRTGLTGLAAGLVAGLVILGGVALLIRVTSVKLPLRAFFQATGALLFAMAVVFVGNGVFALQESGLLKITPMAWLGTGLPVLGMHPSLQALSVQAILIGGAGLALLVMALTGPEEKRPGQVVHTRVGAGA